MTDPLSISASIGGLLTLADIVFRRVFKYVQAVNGASKGITTLSHEIGALYGILSNLNLVASQLDGYTPMPNMQSCHIESCFQTLTKIETLLNKDSTFSLEDRPLESMKRELRWPFKSSEINTLVAEIERHKGTLGLALSADSLSALLRSLSVQSDILETMNGVKSELRQIHEVATRIALNEERRRVLKSFGNLDPRKNQRLSQRLRHPGTGHWLTESEEFRDWSKSEHAKLWLYGIPGAGKTLLASVAIDKILQQAGPNFAFGFFYCDYKDPSTQKPTPIFGSLVQQIAKQDEQSFEKVHEFCNDKNPEYKEDFDYDPEELRDLVLNITLSFNCTAIIVDGLDECGANTAEVTDLLASLHSGNEGPDIKTLFLSRNELDIRERLHEYDQVAIAARSSDLKVYVGAEIETRMRKQKLRFKDPSLKDYIMKRLIEGADGMFRWVACQMDYLCELPNDSARRKALDDLPPTLNETYERILRRVSQKDKAVETLVSRTLRWIVHHRSNNPDGRQMAWTTEALCEAVSVNIGDKRRDTEAICEETDILRSCSSLVRKSASDSSLELAHFTVKEFLLNLENDERAEFAPYNIGSDLNKIDLAKICLTYLNFDDFDQRELSKDERSESRYQEYHLRSYAVSHWLEHARDYLDNFELFSLVKKLMRPSKSNNFVSWAQDYAYELRAPDHVLVDEAIKGASTLHIAAMVNLPEVCEWLLESGCDVNRFCSLGTPLHCALIKDGVLFGSHCVIEYEITFYTRSVEVLLEGGADPNYSFKEMLDWLLSPLLFALDSMDTILSLNLLEKGAKVDDQCIGKLEGWLEDTKFMSDERERERIRNMFDSAVKNSRPECRGRLLELSLRAGHAVQSRVLKAGDSSGQRADLEKYLRTSAEYGQVNIVKQLLEEDVVDIQAREQKSGLTALHFAAMNDHLEIVQLLLDHGAQRDMTDTFGSIPLHFSAKAQSLDCMKFFLTQGTKSTLIDHEGLSAWHLAARREDTHALEILIRYSQPLPRLVDLRAGDGRSPLLYAASVGSTRNVDLLLKHGCKVSEAANDGSTAMHQASRAGSLETIQLLINRGADVHAMTEDGSSMLHYATSEISRISSTVIGFLLEKGLDPCKRRRDDALPINLLIKEEADENDATAGEQVMQILAPLTKNTIFKGLTPLNQICLMQPSSMSSWLLSMFKILLKQGADLGIQDPTGKMALQALVDTWKASNPPTRLSNPPFMIMTRMIDTALNYVPKSGPLHVVCTDPALCIQALRYHDENLVWKLLEHSPDVDKPERGTTIVKTACNAPEIPLLFRELLRRSRSTVDNEFGGELVRWACSKTYDGPYSIVKELLAAGLSPNGCSEMGKTSLMAAVQCAATNMVDLLIKKGANVEAVDFSGWNVAHYACSCTQYSATGAAILRTLRDAGTDWRRRANALYTDVSTSLNGLTPFHLAALNWNSGILKLLLDEDFISDINVLTSQSDSLLTLAASAGLSQNVSLLLAHNIDTNIKNLLGESSLHIASRQGYAEIVENLIEHGCDTELPNGDGLNCEMIAFKHGHKDLAKLLRKQKQEQNMNNGRNSARPTAVADSRSSKALRVAIDLGDLELCERAIKEGANINLKFDDFSGRTPLLYALRKAYEKPACVEIAELLVLHGFSITSTDCSSKIFDSCTAFHHAANLNSPKLLRILLEKHPAEMQQICSSVHPIHLAVARGSLECLNLILEFSNRLGRESFLRKAVPKGLRIPNSRQEFVQMSITGDSMEQSWYIHNGEELPRKLRTATALHIAAHYGDAEIARCLIDNGADIDSMDDRYRTPLQFAVEAGQIFLVELLLKSGANLHCVDTDIHTAAFIASASGQLGSLQTLMSNGADPEIRDVHGNTIWDYLAYSNSFSAFQFLITKGRQEALAAEDRSKLSPFWFMLRFGSKPQISTILNLELGTDFYASHHINALTCILRNSEVSTSLLRMLLRRLPRDLAPTILRHRGLRGGTPLYAACTVVPRHMQLDAISILLKAGADIEQDGGKFGTPLMGACAAGRFSAVKLLVSKGAKTVFVRDGRTFRALHMARHFPKIIRWLLVGRFMEGPKLLDWR